ncbi:MAG: hypothetical protein H0W76_27585 [Pyrinomonadaceae bacterium]|nr:hypothetical protein [Pyrinomonadaceae bacterium]
MRLLSLSPTVLEKVKSYKWDGIIEKHEGPFDYGSSNRFTEPEFMVINGFNVLLPVGRSHHPNITIIRCIESADGNALTIFLKDTTYVDNPRREFLDAGYVAVCDKFPDEDFYLAIVYHEWFMVNNSGVMVEEEDNIH